MKRTMATLLAAVLMLMGMALAESYSDGFRFTYSKEYFEISTDEKGEDRHTVVLTGGVEEWGRTYIRFDLASLGGSDAPVTPDSLAGELPGIEITQGDWKGFSDVLMYRRDVDGVTESCFIAPVDEGLLSVTIGVTGLDDERVAMDRDDRISAVVDSLKMGGGTDNRSEIYERQDLAAAVYLITGELDTWEGCELRKLAYAGDACASPENIAWLNGLAEGRSFDQCLCFLTDLRAPENGGHGLEPDAEYTDYPWWLARENGGDWQLVTWGVDRTSVADEQAAPRPSQTAIP